MHETNQATPDGGLGEALQSSPDERLLEPIVGDGAPYSVPDVHPPTVDTPDKTGQESASTQDWANTANAYAALAETPIHPLLKEHVHRLREEATARVTPIDVDHGEAWAWFDVYQGPSASLKVRRDKRAEDLMTQPLDADLARLFIFEGMGDLLAQKVTSFPVEQQQSVVEELATTGDSMIIRQFPELPGVTDKDKIGQILIMNGGGPKLARYINHFADPNKLIDQILDPASYEKIVSTLHGSGSRDRPVSLYTLPEKDKDLQKHINLTCGALLRQYGIDSDGNTSETTFNVQKVVDSLVDEGWTDTLLQTVNDNENLRGLSGDSFVRLCERNAFNKDGYALNDFVWAKVGFDEASHGDALVAAVDAIELSEDSGIWKYPYIAEPLFTTILSPDQATAISTMLETRAAYSRAECLNKFDELGAQRTPETFSKLFLEKRPNDKGRIIMADLPKYFKDQFQKFAAIGVVFDEDMFVNMYSAALEDKSVAQPEDIVQGLDIFSEQTRQNVQDCQNILAGDISIPMLKTLNDISKPDVSPDLRKLGITNTGDKGRQQLLDVLAKYRSETLQLDIGPSLLNELMNNQLMAEVFKTTVRYEESEWGDSDDDSFKSAIGYYLEALEDGRVEPMPAEYIASDVIAVGLLRQKEQIVWTEDIIDRYTVLRGELQDVSNTLGTKKGFRSLLDDLRNDVLGIVTNIDVKLTAGISSKTGEPLSERERNGMVRRRDELRILVTPPNEQKPEDYPLRSLKAFEQNFRTLAASKELHSSMRKVAFGWALRKNPEWSNRIQTLPIAPEVKDISRVREFIDHIVNQETFKKYFSDKKSAIIFKEMVNTKALEAGIVRAQGVGLSQNTLPLQFVPTRGIALEFSGHIADACWASKYESIAEQMPNMTAVIIKQRPGQKSERLAGAGMLIETKDKKTGQPTLLIRGLNPIENTINQIAVEQFYDSFISYTRGIAEKRSMKLAVVIDNHSGGAASNRPVLWAYMAGIKKSLQRMTVPNEDVEFNGYGTSVFEVYEA